MYIAVTMRLREKEFHIQADSHLPIRNVAKALDESFGLYRGGKHPRFYRSAHQSGLVSGYFTFSQAGIQSGDTLAAVELA